MADLANEELQALRRLCNRSGQPLDGDEDGFECDGCKKLLTRCACPDIAFEALPRLLDEVERLRAEKANLRRALIASGKAVGCVLSDAVSDEFLLGVPQEVLACVAKLRSDVECHSLNHDSALDLLDKERAEVERLRAELERRERMEGN